MSEGQLYDCFLHEGQSYLAFLNALDSFATSAVERERERCVAILLRAKEIADPNPTTQRAYDMLIERIRTQP